MITVTEWVVTREAWPCDDDGDPLPDVEPQITEEDKLVAEFDSMAEAVDHITRYLCKDAGSCWPYTRWGMRHAWWSEEPYVHPYKGTTEEHTYHADYAVNVAVACRLMGVRNLPR